MEEGKVYTLSEEPGARIKTLVLGVGKHGGMFMEVEFESQEALEEAVALAKREGVGEHAG